MPPPSLPEVDHAGVTAMHLADRPSQSVGRVRNGDQMDMVRHQALCPNLDLVGAAPLRHGPQGTLEILITKECLLPVVSPLRDAVRQALGDDSRESGHERSLSTSRSAVDNCVWCPPNPEP